MNFTNLIGHVGQDPIIRTLESGVKVMTFSLATTEKWKQGAETKETTTWHNIVAWRWLADIPVEKGNKVMVIGKITNRKYQDKDGNDRYVTEIVPTYMEVCKRFSKVDESRLPGVDANPYGLGAVDNDGFTEPTPTEKPDDMPF